LPIRQSFAFATTNSKDSTFSIGNFASVIPELKFRHIAVQILFRTALINALHPAFENSEIVFRRISVHVVTGVFARAVADGFMRGKVLIGSKVKAAFICV
jgi:hypothetical protein